MHIQCANVICNMKYIDTIVMLLILFIVKGLKKTLNVLSCFNSLTLTIMLILRLIFEKRYQRIRAFKQKPIINK